MKKVLIGFALVAILCMIDAAGYKFGQHLAHKDTPAEHAGGA